MEGTSGASLRPQALRGGRMNADLDVFTCLQMKALIIKNKYSQ